MPVITISKGTFSGGKALAEYLSRRLGFPCIDREDLVARAAAERVSQSELRAALEEPLPPPGRFNHKRYVYLALIEAVLFERVCGGRAIYHGLAGHILLRKAPGVLRLRVIAPLEARVLTAERQLNLSRRAAEAHIAKLDSDRRNWARFLHGVDWSDPTLYDLVINLEHMRVEEAGAVVAALLEQPGFASLPEHRVTLENLALAARVRAALALNPFTSNLEVEVEAAGGRVSIRGELCEEFSEARTVASAIPGVCEVEEAGRA
jgi:hypothetical protein